MLENAPRGMLSFAVPIASSDLQELQQSLTNGKPLIAGTSPQPKKWRDVIGCDVPLVERIIVLWAERLLSHYLHHVVAHSYCHKLIESALVKAAVAVER